MKISSAAIALFALVLAGCSAGLSEKDLVGQWSTKLEVVDSALLAEMKKMGGTEKDLPVAKKMIEGVSVNLDLKEDKTFILGAGTGNIEGKWALASQKVTLTPEKVGGMSVEEFKKQAPTATSQTDPIVLETGTDGKALTGDFQKIAKVNFTKSTEEKAPEKKAEDKK